MPPGLTVTLPRRLVLLRHSWAGQRTADPDADRRRPLDADGRAQAARIPGHLATTLGSDLTSAVLVGSPLTRCVATLEPLASFLDVAVTTDERLAEAEVPLTSTDAWPDAAWYGARALQAIGVTAERHPDTATMVVCSHGEILPALLAAITGHLPLRIPAEVDLSAKALAKGGAWLVDVDHAEVTVIAPPDA